MVALVGLVREEGLGVVVLANRDHVEVRHALMYGVLDRLLEEGATGEAHDWSVELKALYDSLAAESEATEREARDRRVEDTHPSHALAAYAGTYRDPLYGTLRLDLRDGALHADWGPGQPGSLEHWHYDTFRVTWDARWRGTALVTFELDAAGEITAARVGATRLPRVDEPEAMHPR
jgi:hypothetical protein